jgi:hypothetical protein
MYACWRMWQASKAPWPPSGRLQDMESGFYGAPVLRDRPFRTGDQTAALSTPKGLLTGLVALVCVRTVKMRTMAISSR